MNGVSEKIFETTDKVPFLKENGSGILKRSCLKEKSETEQKIDIIDDEIQENSLIENNRIENITYWLLLQNIFPNVCISLMYQGLSLIESHFTGQLNDTYIMNGVYLGQNYNNLILYFICSGLIEGMVYLCPKSFGSKNYYLLGLQTNQTRLLILIFFSSLTIFSVFFSTSVLNLMSGSEKINGVAHRYILFMIPSDFFSLFYEIYVKYAETQLIYRPTIYALIIALTIHPFQCYLFISYLQLGEIGQAISSGIAELVKVSVMFLYFTIKNPNPKSNFFFNKDILLGFGKLFKLSLLNALLFYFGNAGGCILGVISSYLDDTENAKYVVLINITMISISIGYGFDITANIIVGNYIGCNSAINIKKSIIYSIVLSSITGILFCFICIIFPRQLCYFFSELESVYDSKDMYFLIFLMGVSEVFDIIVSCLQGCLLGLGEIHSTFIYSFIGYFLLIPGIAYLLTFYFQIGVAGMFYSPLIVYSGVTIIFGFKLYFADFEKLCDSYQNDLEKEELIKKSFVEISKQSIKKVNEKII